MSRKEGIKLSEAAIQKADLLDHIITEKVVIYCSNCSKESISGKDEFDAVDDFYKEGWRVIKGKSLCKTCILEQN